MPSQSISSPSRFQYICLPKSIDVLLRTNAAEWIRRGGGRCVKTLENMFLLNDCQSILLYMETPQLLLE